MSSYNQDFRDIVIKKYKSGFTAEALRDLDPRKIKYFDVNLEDYE